MLRPRMRALADLWRAVVACTRRSAPSLQVAVCMFENAQSAGIAASRLIGRRLAPRRTQRARTAPDRARRPMNVRPTSDVIGI